MLLLDDPLSAVDRLTKSVIMERLFGPLGILQELGTATIHATQDRMYSITYYALQQTCKRTNHNCVVALL